MKEWLQKILGDAYSETIEQQIAAQIAKQYVAKADYDKQKQSYEQQIKGIRVTAAIEAAMTKAGAKSVKAAKALLDMDKIMVDENGNVTGIEDQMQALTTGKDTAFLFEQAKPNVSGVVPASAGASGKAPAKQTGPMIL